jgi:Family of unknown function (DUF6455)
MATSGRFWPTRARLRRRHRLMRRMMRTSGVQADAAARIDGGLAFGEARAKCRYMRRLAGVWLASAEGLQVPPDFCPNACFFRSFRIIDR